MALLSNAFSILDYEARIKQDRAAVHAGLFAEAERILNTMLKAGHTASTFSGFAFHMILEWLRRASPLTVETFLEVHAAGTLPNLSEFSGLLTSVSGLRSPDILLRETLMYHHKVKYYRDDLPEVIASLAAVHLMRPGMEMDPLDYPDEADHAVHMALFLLSYALRYDRSGLVVDAKHDGLFTLYRCPLPRDEELIRFAVENPDRIDEIRGVLDDRPGADAQHIVSVLNAPVRALSDGLL